MLLITPLIILEEAQAVALIRNECRYFMTNDQREISPLKQKKWFKDFYTKQNPKKYRVWLLKDDKKNIIGYFAAKEEEEGYYISEAIHETNRGKGMGSFLLKNLISQENFNSKPLYADIFNHNLASISLHQKFDFIPHSTINQEITRYVNDHFCFL